MNEKLKGLGAIAFVIAFVWAGWYLCSYSTPAQIESVGQPATGQVLVFPPNLEPVLAYAYAFQTTGPYIVYLCRHLETGEYITCVPTERHFRE